MSHEKLTEALAKGCLVCDGATGTMLNELLAPGDAVPRELVPLERAGVLRGLHRAYLEAGADIVKTATFGSSLAELLAIPGFLPGAGTDPAAGCRSLNAAAASLAAKEASRATAADGRKRWVAGSVGPGRGAPSLGSGSYAELRASYLPQMLGLMEGGVDLVLVETVQDTLQCKAAAGALAEACGTLGRRVPFIVSATVDANGRLLCGADLDAFAAIMEPFGPAALGVNCSGGPRELEGALGTLSRATSLPVSVMPNAGLPVAGEGRARWPVEPGEFGRLVAGLALRHGAAIAGGCCGTGPAHIAALRRELDATRGAGSIGPRRAAPRSFAPRSFALASGSRAFRADGDFLVIDERANASGSASFKAALAGGDDGAMAGFVIERGSRGAAAVDLCVAAAAGEEASLLARIAGRCSPVMEAALSLDSVEPAAIAAALPMVGGRPLVNSVNLEDRGRAERIFSLAREYGAAVVCLALDRDGPAKTAEAKLDICARLRELAVRAGLSDADLAFDACTFPVAAGDASAASETLAAVRSLSREYPRAATVLGVGNVSFGLPRALRAHFTARFLQRARRAGLGAAIVDPRIAGLVPGDAFSSLADAVLDGGGAEALEALVSGFSATPEGRGSASAEADTERVRNEPEDALGALASAVARGDVPRAGQAGARARLEGTEFPLVAETITAALLGVAAGYESGRTALPAVMRSADAAREALKEARAALAGDRDDGPPVVLATVRGDLHDIGKNLAGMVMEASGYRVLDLGTDRRAADIALAASRGGALAVGVSGLLTRSLPEMEAVARELSLLPRPPLLICGGAAARADHVRDRLLPILPGRVAWAGDPFHGVRLLREFGCGPDGAACEVAVKAGDARTGGPGPLADAGSARAPAPQADGSCIPSRDSDGACPAGELGYGELLSAMDAEALLRGRWRYPASDLAEGRAALREAVADLTAAGGVRARYLAAACGVTKPDADTVGLTVLGGAFPVSFSFPRETGGGRRSVADWFHEGGQATALCVTLGEPAAAYLRSVRASGSADRYLRAHGLLAALAEAAAVLVHRLAAGGSAAETGGAGSVGAMTRARQAAGRRYSFGFPGCPGAEANGRLLDLLGAASIGLRCGPGGQLEPEFSVTALVCADPRAEYLDA